jgi:hypothetical protein
MATRFVLTPESAQFPNTNYPQLMSIHTTERIMVLAFDAGTAETCYWRSTVPQGWTGTITAVVNYAMASATSGKIDYEIQVEAVTPGDSLDIDSTTSYDTTNTITAPTVPGTAGYVGTFTCTLTNNDSSAAGDLISFALKRDAADGTNDTATGDCYIASVEIRDGA